MQSGPKPQRPIRSTIHKHLESLGLRTYNNEHHSNRAIFKYKPVIRLYRVELLALVGILCRDEGSVLHREDPNLFDDELNQLLEEFGPLIWPRPGVGNRDHLCEAQAGTSYERDLVYPLDTAILKDRLRGIVLAKVLQPNTDVQALIEKKHKYASIRVRSSQPSTPAKKGHPVSIEQKPTSIAMPKLQSSLNAWPNPNDATGNSESEDSVIGTTTRRRAVSETTSSHTGFSSVELRLYRKITLTPEGTSGSVLPYGPMFLTADCTTIDGCFTRICDKIRTDCGFMVFHLPEDMSREGSIRVNRGSASADVTFQRVLQIFRTSKKFPGEPQYRSVEVEVGLDMPLDD